MTGSPAGRRQARRLCLRHAAPYARPNQLRNAATTDIHRHESVDHLLKFRQIRRVHQPGADGLACHLAQKVVTQAAHARTHGAAGPRGVSCTQTLAKKLWRGIQAAVLQREGDASDTQRRMPDQTNCGTQRRRIYTDTSVWTTYTSFVRFGVCASPAPMAWPPSSPKQLKLKLRTRIRTPTRRVREGCRVRTAGFSHNAADSNAAPPARWERVPHFKARTAPPLSRRSSMNRASASGLSHSLQSCKLRRTTQRTHESRIDA
jgi:hypothetical protein